MDKRIIKTKKAIRKAFLQIVLEKDISKITIKEVSEKANINRKTFYSHYSCIEDVLHDIESDMVEKFTDSLNYIVQNRLISFKQLVILLEEAIKSDYDYNHLIDHFEASSIVFTECKNGIYNFFEKKYIAQIKESDQKKMRYFYSFVAGGIVNAFEMYIKNKDLDIDTFCDYIDDFLAPYLDTSNFS